MMSRHRLWPSGERPKLTEKQTERGNARMHAQQSAMPKPRRERTLGRAGLAIARLMILNPESLGAELGKGGEHPFWGVR